MHKACEDKSFFGYSKYNSGLYMLIELGLPSFGKPLPCCIILK